MVPIRGDDLHLDELYYGGEVQRLGGKGGESAIASKNFSQRSHTLTRTARNPLSHSTPTTKLKALVLCRLGRCAALLWADVSEAAKVGGCCGNSSRALQRYVRICNLPIRIR